MHTQAKWYIGGFAIVFIAVLAVIFGAPYLYKGALMPVQAAGSCGSQWTKVFEGKAGQDGVFDVALALTENNLKKFLLDGCSFKVVKDWTIPDTRFMSSFDCATAEYQNATNRFQCLGAPYADENNFSKSESAGIDFIRGTAGSYRGLENNEAGEKITVMIFARK